MNKIALASMVVAILSSFSGHTALAQGTLSRTPSTFDFSGKWRVSGNFNRGMTKRVTIGQVGGLRASSVFIQANYPPIAKCRASGAVVIDLITAHVMAAKKLPSELWNPSVSVPGVKQRTLVLKGSIRLCESKQYVKYCRGGKGGTTYTRPFVATFVADPSGRILRIKGTFKTAYYKLHRHGGRRGGKARYSCQRHPPGDKAASFNLTRVG